MHFALPPRKQSHPPPYTGGRTSSRIPTLRRSRLQFLALCALGVISFIFIFRRIATTAELIPSDAPPVVIVTVLDQEAHTPSYLADVQDNRVEYARRHGYATFFANTTLYNLGDAPASWARVPAMRHAMTKYPYSKYFWFLDQNSLIMNPEMKIEDYIMSPKRIESLMIKDQPIVPPDSVIRTFPHLRGDQVDLVIAQDKDGLSPRSFVLRSGDWAKYFLDAWFDPLYRSYNFQKAETHALEHIVQWHPTILSKLVLFPQKVLNAYSHSTNAATNGEYKDGDFIISFADCENSADCERDADVYARQWRTIFHVQE